MTIALDLRPGPQLALSILTPLEVRLLALWSQRAPLAWIARDEGIRPADARRRIHWGLLKLGLAGFIVHRCAGGRLRYRSPDSLDRHPSPEANDDRAAG